MFIFLDLDNLNFFPDFLLCYSKKVKMPSESADSPVNATTQDDLDVPELPKKRFYRQRAHANPLNDHTFE